jgi:hypothetical protein
LRGEGREKVKRQMANVVFHAKTQKVQRVLLYVERECKAGGAGNGV